MCQIWRKCDNCGAFSAKVAHLRQKWRIKRWAVVPSTCVPNLVWLRQLERKLLLVKYINFETTVAPPINIIDSKHSSLDALHVCQHFNTKNAKIRPFVHDLFNVLTCYAAQYPKFADISKTNVARDLRFSGCDPGPILNKCGEIGAFAAFVAHLFFANNSKTYKVRELNFSGFL